MQSNFKINVFEISFLNRVIKKPFFPYIFQFLTLIFFFILIIKGLIPDSPASNGTEPAFFYKQINLTTLIVWGIWWPGLVLITILLGRLWCTVCPMELISNIFNRLSRLTGFKGLKLNPFLASGYIVLCLYILLQLLVGFFCLHRVPTYTAYMLIGLISLSILAGLVFKDQRAFCKAFCPASLLLKVYSLFTSLVLRTKNDETCSQCSSKDCVSDKYINNLDTRSCPHHIKPYNLNINDDCVNCFQCVKICPYNNIGYGVTKESFKERTLQNLSLPAALFIFTAFGFELNEIIKPYTSDKEIFSLIPQLFTIIFNTPQAYPWIEVLWFFLIIPITIFIVVKSFSIVDKNDFGSKHFITQLALFFLPVIATMLAVKALIKLNYWSRFLPEALTQLHSLFSPFL